MTDVLDWLNDAYSFPHRLLTALPGLPSTVVQGLSLMLGLGLLIVHRIGRRDCERILPSNGADVERHIGRSGRGGNLSVLGRRMAASIGRNFGWGATGFHGVAQRRGVAVSISRSAGADLVATVGILSFTL